MPSSHPFPLPILTCAKEGLTAAMGRAGANSISAPDDRMSSSRQTRSSVSCCLPQIRTAG